MVGGSVGIEDSSDGVIVLSRLKGKPARRSRLDAIARIAPARIKNGKGNLTSLAHSKTWEKIKKMTKQTKPNCAVDPISFSVSRYSFL